MSKQMTDAALRQQVAQWTRTALGQVIEDDRERSAAAPAVERTTCCIVGSGPAGAVLALLLARKGIPVVLLESHSDFDRDFRGDILQASALEIMDELGLTDRLFQLPHTKLPPFAFQMDACSCTQIDLIRLHTRHRYITLLAQADFLEVVTGEAKRYPTFRLVMGAHVERLIEESGAICGVRYRGHDGWHEVRALLTIGADGRFSWVRRLVGWKPIPVAPPTDVFWFRLPHRPDDPETMLCRTSNGRMLIAYNRSEYWQIAYLLPKGSDQQAHSPGLQILRHALVELMPEFADRAERLQEWNDVLVLLVEPSRLARWYCPGLLLIGDAAHVMASVGNVGIISAIQDAIVAANVLSSPLKTGHLQIHDLARVQHKRELSIRLIQWVQALIQLRECAERGASGFSNKLHVMPDFVHMLPHLPLVRNLPNRILTLGIRRVHVKNNG